MQQWINRNCNAGTIFLMLNHMHIIVMWLPCRIFSPIHKYLYHLLSSLPPLTMFQGNPLVTYIIIISLSVSFFYLLNFPYCVLCCWHVLVWRYGCPAFLCHTCKTTYNAIPKTYWKVRLNYFRWFDMFHIPCIN